MPVRKVLVVGGGAAGMLAALFAAENGAAVTLLERNEKLGKKVYITGKGRCGGARSLYAGDLSQSALYVCIVCRV